MPRNAEELGAAEATPVVNPSGQHCQPDCKPYAETTISPSGLMTNIGVPMMVGG